MVGDLYCHPQRFMEGFPGGGVAYAEEASDFLPVVPSIPQTQHCAALVAEQPHHSFWIQITTDIEAGVVEGQDLVFDIITPAQYFSTIQLRSMPPKHPAKGGSQKSLGSSRP